MPVGTEKTAREEGVSGRSRDGARGRRGGRTLVELFERETLRLRNEEEDEQRAESVPCARAERSQHWM